LVLLSSPCVDDLSDKHGVAACRKAFVPLGICRFLVILLHISENSGTFAARFGARMKEDQHTCRVGLDKGGHWEIIE